MKKIAPRRDPSREILDHRKPTPIAAAEVESRKPGRPKAKHSDKENYAQMSLYIRRDVRNRTKARLFEQGGEFSALVESLLEAWLKEQNQLTGVQ